MAPSGSARQPGAKHRSRSRSVVLRAVEVCCILALSFGHGIGLGEGLLLVAGIVFTIAVVVDLAT